jgi:hypothetical protein
MSEEADFLDVAMAERRAELDHASIVVGIRGGDPQEAEAVLSFATMYRRVALDAIRDGKPLRESVLVCANSWGVKHGAAMRAKDLIGWAVARSGDRE